MGVSVSLSCVVRVGLGELGLVCLVGSVKLGKFVWVNFYV